MIRAIFVFAIVISTMAPLCVQSQSASQHNVKVANPAFDKTITSLLSFSTPILSVSEAKSMGHVIYLDAREPDEFNISHIPGAVNIGFDHWDQRLIQSIPKDQPLIVYCSVGYRSEKIAEKIIALGYQKVYNLYGSIFEWANEGYPLQNNQGEPTYKLHTYSRMWSKWVDNTAIEKTW